MFNSSEIAEVLSSAVASEEIEHPNFTQFEYYYEGFAPCSPTIKAMPPGVYGVYPGPTKNFFRPKTVRTDDLIVLPDSKSEEVVSEIENFWKLKSKFHKLGFLHKRGILMYGPAGSGKSTTINIISSKMVKMGGIVILGHSNIGLLSGLLRDFRSVEPNRPIVVLLEDLDSLIQSSEESILSLLDGEDNIENVVYVATTNYLSLLDKRITNRPSRFDKIVEIGFPDFAGRLLYLKSRKTGLSDAELNNLAEVSEGFGIAHLKELIISVLCFGISVENAVTKLRSMESLGDEGDLPKKFKGIKRR
jgi:SpoVK/Ycf46/Vps4 family AAA+-type ATPase